MVHPDVGSADLAAQDDPTDWHTEPATIVEPLPEIGWSVGA